MNRDTIIHILVAAEAQLRRIERLAASIGDATERQHRIPPLLAETRRMLQQACSRIEQAEGRANRKGASTKTPTIITLENLRAGRAR